MTVKELRTLIDNLDEYIHVPGGIERLKKTVLHLAVTGQLVPQDPSEGTGEELYNQIQSEKEALVKEGKLKKQKPLTEIAKDEIPFEAPRNWKWVRLDDAYDVRDGTHDTPKYVSRGFPLITSKNLSTGKLDMSNVQYISEADHNKIKDRSAVSRDDILFAMIGSIGNPVIVDTDTEFSIKNVALFKPYMCNLYEPKWLLALLFSATDTMKKRSAGGVQAFVSLSFIRNFAIPLPPFSEQKRIVEKVDAIFTLIDELSVKYRAEQARRKKLVSVALAGLSRGDSELAFKHLTEIIRTKADAAELRKTILQLAVSGQLVPQDPAEGTGEELYQQIQAEKTKLVREGKLKPQKTLPPIKESDTPFQIPQNWRWTRLGELTNYGTAEKAKPSDITGNTWVLELEDIEKDSSILLKKVDASTRNSLSDKNVFYKYDVLYGKLRPYLDKVIVADDGGVCSSEILPLRVPGGSIEPEYLRLCLKSPSFVNTVNELTYGVKMPRLGTDDGRKMPITLPPLAEQTRIVQKTTQLLDLVTELEKHLEK